MSARCTSPRICSSGSIYPDPLGMLSSFVGAQHRCALLSALSVSSVNSVFNLFILICEGYND
jgi:hypothetical protein